MSMKVKLVDSVKVLLEKTVAEILIECPDILDRMNRPYDLSLIQILRSKAEYSAAVLADNSLKSLGHGWVQLAGNGHAVDAHALPAILLSRVLLGSSSRSVLREFRAFALDGCTEVYWYAAMAGVSIAEPISFSEHVVLIPWDCVPDCSPKRRLSDNRELRALGGLTASPNCAIRIGLPKRKVFFPTAMQVDPDEYPLTEVNDCHGVGMDILRAATLATGTQTGILISWTEATNPAASDFLSSAISVFPGTNDGGLFGASLVPSSVDPEETRAIFKNLQSFKKKDKAAMRTAIDRINNSWTWKSPAEQAIDLGIALEVLLLHDNSKDRGELRYRLSERGAKLLSQNGSEQLEYFRKLKTIYDLRSAAVHVGSIEDSEATREKLAEAKNFCARIANKIIKLGGFPNWEVDYIFSK